MKAKVLIVGIIAFTLTACNKDLYTTNPQLLFQSVNSTNVPIGGSLDFKMQVTDKQGDIQDSMWIERVSYIPDCLGNDSAVLSYPMPQFTGTSDLKAQIDVYFTYGTNDGVDAELTPCSVGVTGVAITDSCYFKFWMKDNANHVSDTVRSPTIVLLDQ
jgi:hypothetical protein